MLNHILHIKFHEPGTEAPGGRQWWLDRLASNQCPKALGPPGVHPWPTGALGATHRAGGLGKPLGLPGARWANTSSNRPGHPAIAGPDMQNPHNN